MSEFIEWLSQFDEEDTTHGDVAQDVMMDVHMGCLPAESTAEDVYEHMVSWHDATFDSMVVLKHLAEQFGTPVEVC